MHRERPLPWKTIAEHITFELLKPYGITKIFIEVNTYSRER